MHAAVLQPPARSPRPLASIQRGTSIASLSAPMWREYIVRQGDFLARLADRYGFDAEAVWSDDRNRALRELRADPDVLCPGDVLWIPEESEERLPLSLGQPNTFVAEVDEITLTLTLQMGSEPFRNERYEIEGPATPPKERTDKDGKLTFTVPADVDELRLFLPDRNLIVPVRIGHLDPPGTISGARGRLVNLGYYGSGYEDADRDDPEAFHLALLAFQRDHGIEPPGRLDARTANALKAAHRY